MAASQFNCLVDKPWRSSGVPTPGACTEDQRLAIEQLLARGISAYQTQCAKNKLHPFLSHREIERCLREDEGAMSSTLSSESGSSKMTDSASLTYWPEKSEKDLPELDLGWPVQNSFRGVTRAIVHTQPPLEEDELCIKNVVRKLIQNAQKVIAIVMDSFTDPDIFGDIMEAARKRWVPVYIIHDSTNFPEFLAMCKHCKVDFDAVRKMRVRTLSGLTFSARTGKKLVGSLGERFMIVDGDKAITGSYSFTWMASRIDRHIMTLLSGQIVEKFDFEFRTLYAQSQPASKTAALPLFNHPLTNKVETDGPKPSYGQKANGTRPKAANLAIRVTNPLYALVLQGVRKETLERKETTTALSDAGANKTLERQITLPAAKTRSIEGRKGTSPPLAEMAGVSDRKDSKPLEVPKVPDHVRKHKLETCYKFEDGKKVSCESKLAMSAITDSTATKRRTNTLGEDYLEKTKTISKSTFQLNDESLQGEINSSEPSVSDSNGNKPHEKHQVDAGRRRSLNFQLQNRHDMWEKNDGPPFPWQMKPLSEVRDHSGPESSESKQTLQAGYKSDRSYKDKLSATGTSRTVENAERRQYGRLCSSTSQISHHDKNQARFSVPEILKEKKEANLFAKGTRGLAVEPPHLLPWPTPGAPRPQYLSQPVLGGSHLQTGVLGCPTPWYSQPWYFEPCRTHHNIQGLHSNYYGGWLHTMGLGSCFSSFFHGGSHVRGFLYY